MERRGGSGSRGGDSSEIGKARARISEFDAACSTTPLAPLSPGSPSRASQAALGGLIYQVLTLPRCTSLECELTFRAVQLIGGVPVSRLDPEAGTTQLFRMRRSAMKPKESASGCLDHMRWVA